MPILALRICLLAVVVGACASHSSSNNSSGSSHLDGPVDYKTEGGFIRTTTNVHVELDGSATKQVTSGAGPTKMTSGTLEAADMESLRDDIAAVDLASLRDSYNCGDFKCGADFPVATVTIAADGATKQILVDRGISDSDLPAGLVTILADLDDIVSKIP
jgi:hypothetical protein